MLYRNKEKYEALFASPLEVYKESEKNQYTDYLDYLYGNKFGFPEELSLSQTYIKKDLSMFFKVGRFYLFNYSYFNDGKEREYVDLRPLIYVLDIRYHTPHKIFITGLNFNFMTKDEKVSFLEILYRLYLNIYKEDIHKEVDNKSIEFYQYREEQIQKFYKIFKDKIPNIDDNIRNYQLNRIDVQNIMFIRPQDYNILYDFEGGKKSLKGMVYKI